MDETSPKDKEGVEKKASVIFKVRSGTLTAKAGAALLGLSRKSYFEWEARGLKGMLSALEEKSPGRPKKDGNDPEKDAMQKRIAQLEEELLVAKKTLEVRKLLAAWEDLKKSDAGKKTPKKKSLKES